MGGISQTFSALGAVNPKILLIGPPSGVKNRLAGSFCSLNIEHINADTLYQEELSKRTTIGVAVDKASRSGQPVPDSVAIAVHRRWFWSRKPNRPFLLSGFPENRLQASVLDTWLDAREENLTACVFISDNPKHSDSGLIEYYADQGLAEIFVSDDSESDQLLTALSA